jgi:hypothetical protein
MPETEFDLSYKGDALADGRMAVRDLAPALLALGEIFADASALIEPAKPLGSSETEMVLSITTLTFVEGNKWRLTDGTRTFYAGDQRPGVPGPHRTWERVLPQG